MNEQEKQETMPAEESAEQNAAAAQEQPATGAPPDAAEDQADSQSADAQGEVTPVAEAPVREEASPATDNAARMAALTQRAAEAELRAAAALAGVSAEKLPYVMRMCDRAALCAEGADMGKLAQEQIAAVIRDVPEMAGGRPVAGSLGDHKRISSGPDPEDEARTTFAKYL